MPKIKKNKWEYLDLKTTKIPENVRNSADPKVIENYLQTSGNTLSPNEREYLNHHLASLNKINEFINKTKEEVAAGTYKPIKPETMILEDLKLYHIHDYVFRPRFQTGDFGCWSCFYNNLLLTRGIRDLSQEDIRAFRPKKTGNDAYNIDSDAEFNTDIPVNVIDMADLAINLIPDTMIKSTEIWSYNKFKEGAPQNPEEKLAYSTAAVQGIKEQIITSIRDHKSPVGIMMEGHYVTITGIEGDTISYYNSMPTELSGNDPEYIYQENLGTFLDKALNGENASYITLTWSEDIKLSKDGKYIYGTSLPNLSVDDSGRVITNAKESQAMFLDDRHQDGMVIGTTGGIDIADADSEYRKHNNNGFFKVDKAYLPKQVNLASLKNAAEKRSEEAENILKEQRTAKLNEQKAIENTIALQKSYSRSIIPEEPQEPQIERYKINIVYNRKPQFGGGNFVNFKDTFSGCGWNRDRFDTLFRAFSNLYDAMPLTENSPRKKAMDSFYTNHFFSGEEQPGTVSELKYSLTNYLNTIQNGDTFYDETFQPVVLQGIKGRRNLKPEAAVSVTYIKSFIKVLSEIEKYNPYLMANDIDIDRFIAPNGKIRTAEIKNDPAINPSAKKNQSAKINILNKPDDDNFFLLQDEPDNINININTDQIVSGPIVAENKKQAEIKNDKTVPPKQPEIKAENAVPPKQPEEDKHIKEDNEKAFIWEEESFVDTDDRIRHEDDGIIISPKCKYKFYNTGESMESAFKKLVELDKVPSEEKDRNLIFSLILVTAYWKVQQRYDAIYLTDEDLRYLANRYENDPKFAVTIENMVEYGYGDKFWGDKTKLTEYIYHNHSYDVDQLSKFEEQRPAALDENEVVEFSKKERKNADDRMYRSIKAVLIGKQKMITEEKKEITKDKEKLAGGLSLLQEDLKKGKHHYDDITFAKNPKIDYRSAADIIVRARAKRPVLINLDHTDWQFGDRNNDLRFKASEIANSLNFYMYIQENRELIPTLTIEEYVKGYEDFNKAALEADSKTAVTDTTFKMNEYEVFNQQNIQKGCKDYIQSFAKSEKPFSRLNIMDAVDLIIAKTLTAKAANAAVFDRLKLDAAENGPLDKQKFKDTVTRMRTEIISNPLFLNAFSKRVAPTEFYEEYRKAVNADINKKRADDLARRKAINKTRDTKTRINTFMKEHTHKITKEQAAEIKTAYENLLEYNKGKSPSDLMKKFMKSLKDVVSELNTPGNKRNIHMDKLSSLNRYTLKYYDKRQGIFHDPYTDNGKARLSAAERLANTTNAIIKDMAEQHPELQPGYIPSEADNNKIAANNGRASDASNRDSTASITDEKGNKNYELPMKK